MDKNFEINLEGKNLQELQKLLKNLKLYKDLITKLGNRGKNLFKSLVYGKSLYKIEYFLVIGKENALQEAKKVYENIFSDKNIDKQEIILKSKKTLDGGIRVFKNDDLVDLSFKKVEKILK